MWLRTVLKSYCCLVVSQLDMQHILSRWTLISKEQLTVQLIFSIRMLKLLVSDGESRYLAQMNRFMRSEKYLLLGLMTLNMKICSLLGIIMKWNGSIIVLFSENLIMKQGVLKTIWAWPGHSDEQICNKSRYISCPSVHIVLLCSQFNIQYYSIVY